MSSNRYSAAIKQAWATGTDVVLYTLVLRLWDDNNQPMPIGIVRDNDDLDAPLVAGGPLFHFTACAFDLTLPGQDDGQQLPELTLTVDNVSGLLTPYLKRALVVGKPISVECRPYLASDLSAPQMNPPLVLDLASISVTTLKVTAKAHIADVTTRSFPAKPYTRVLFPGLAS